MKATTEETTKGLAAIIMKHPKAAAGFRVAGLIQAGNALSLAAKKAQYQAKAYELGAMGLEVEAAEMHQEALREIVPGSCSWEEWRAHQEEVELRQQAEWQTFLACHGSTYYANQPKSH